jgi:hypothetical protein
MYEFTSSEGNSGGVFVTEFHEIGCDYRRHLSHFLYYFEGVVLGRLRVGVRARNCQKSRRSFSE